MTIWDLLLWIYMAAILMLPSIILVPAILISYGVAFALGFLACALPLRVVRHSRD